MPFPLPHYRGIGNLNTQCSLSGLRSYMVHPRVITCLQSELFGDGFVELVLNGHTAVPRNYAEKQQYFCGLCGIH